MIDYKKYIEDNKDYAIEVLKNLVSFKSVLDEYKENSFSPFGEGNKKALEYMMQLGQNDGFVTKNIDNYAMHIEYGDGEEILGILGHLDVVPVNAKDWNSDPFTLTYKDKKFYARGSIDDKGPVVASYIALKILKDIGFKPNKKIRLILGCDEESGSRCLQRYFKYEPKPSIGFSPDAEFPLIYGEKAMMSYDILGKDYDSIISEFSAGDRYNIVPAIAKMKLKKDLKNEYLEFLKRNNYHGEVKGDEYIAYGLASHAMCPDKGINAIFILFKFLQEFDNSQLVKFMNKYFVDDTLGLKIGYNYYDEDMKELTSNLAIFNLKDNNFKLGVNCRIPLDSLFTVIEDCLKRITKEFNYSYNILSTSLRHFVDPNSYLVKTLMSVYQSVTNDYKNPPVTIGGGTYARELSNAVAFGPLFVGREDVCHIANEYIHEDDFYKAIEIYLLAIYKLCS